MRNKLKLSHIQIIALGFALMIIIGTILLMLPISTRTGISANFMDAFFTATSASCVTGLVVRDTSIYWSYFGQAIILCLIQIGGLGFMTIATMFFLLLRKRMNLKERELLTESINFTNVGEILRLAKKIIYGTIIIEGVGSILLMIKFIPQYGLNGIWMSVFHSVSSFCNAGFDIFGEYYGEFVSLTAYTNSWYINIITMLLIIIGGIGFIVWDDVATYKIKFKKYHLHSKIAISTTLILTIFGSILFVISEWDVNTHSINTHILSSVFNSVTTRTAGFNTIDLSKLSDSGKLISIILMFIGGSPGSTAGGIKTTTIAVLVVYAVSHVRNREITVFKRSIEESFLKKSITIFLINLSLALFFTIVLSIINDIQIMDLAFEAFSAIGTVGMSVGITRDFNVASKIMLIFLMYCGRVGSVTFATAITGNKITPKIKNVSEKIIVG